MISNRLLDETIESNTGNLWKKKFTYQFINKIVTVVKTFHPTQKSGIHKGSSPYLDGMVYISEL